MLIYGLKYVSPSDRYDLKESSDGKFPRITGMNRDKKRPRLLRGRLAIITFSFNLFLTNHPYRAGERHKTLRNMFTGFF